MCKHILNAQVAIRAPCCRRFFDCPQCHADAVGDDHKLAKTTEMQLVCKQCKRAFRRDLTRFEQEDEYCPHCDNHYVIDAQTPAPTHDAGEHEASENADLRHIDASLTEALDPRVRYDPRRDWLAVEASQKEDAARIDEGGLQGVIQDSVERERRMAAAAKQIGQLQAQQQQAAAAGHAAWNDDDLDWS